MKHAAGQSNAILNDSTSLETYRPKEYHFGCTYSQGLPEYGTLKTGSDWLGLNRTACKSAESLPVDAATRNICKFNVFH